MFKDNTDLEQTVSTTVLAMETSDYRFENFCNGIVSTLEGGALVFSTSRSWDLGRDGVGAGRASGVYACTSLRDDVDDKCLSDIARITSTTRNITRIYFCSSHPLSEHRRRENEIAISEKINYAFPIVILGSTQLVETDLHKGSGLLERHYGSEISNTIRSIGRGPNEDTEIRGLRLALISSSGDNSAEIRSEVYSSGILDVLADNKTRTLEALTRDFSGALKLQRNVAHEALLPAISRLHAKGLIKEPKGGIYGITPEGHASRQEREKNAVVRLLEGRKAIRAVLESSIGSRFLDSQFNRIWEVFEERMAQYFLSRGDALVEEISALINDDHDTVEPISPLSFLDDFASAVASTSTHQEQREELRQAVRDMFTDRTSAATDWLVRLSASFLSLCAAGLEHSSSAALSRLFARTTLVLDTDVVLSLLGEGETEHKSIETIVDRWTRLNGSVFAPTPVLEEVAYHASIATRDYREIRHILPGTEEDRLQLIDNVFVRSFAQLMADKKVQHSHWPTYLNSYKGDTEYDFRKVSAALSDYKIQQLPCRSIQEQELEEKVRQFLNERAIGKLSSRAQRNALDKAARDAQIYSALIHHLKKLKNDDPAATCLLVSSARRLVQVDTQFQKSGEQQLVISVAALLQLIALLPDVSLGLSAMKAFLFDEKRRGFSSELERSLLRLVRSSGNYSLPWAKRGTLMRFVRDRLIQDAHQQGDRQLSADDLARIEYDSLTPEKAPQTAALLHQALEAIAVDSRLEQENSALRAQIQDLKNELEQRPTTATPVSKRRRHKRRK
ncbi:hypothetical protein ACIQRH_00995 [Pseudomonas sp. NPDC090964]|uniref:hypothetical protein n=1 Tax=unclassified Pseudomonas TaxID=196821 RepID=UPI0008126F8E|nr:hypothetical protein [Pseudomonas sp. 44 R 15]CRM32868.1 hypothetical protein [Pseudomonas sp. 44 R 15]